MEMQIGVKGGDICFSTLKAQSELEVLAACAARLKKIAPMALRVNPDVSAENASLYFDRAASA